MAATTPADARVAHGGLSRGTLVVMAAEALAFPAGLAATILLTRHLSSSDYGALALALAGTAWLEWTVVSLFSRVGWKLIAETDEWRAVAPAVVRLFLLASLPVAAILFAGASAIANLLDAPRLAAVLRVLALDIPFFAVAQAYRGVLIGRGLHGARATSAAVRWTVRAALVALGVLLGFSLPGLAALYVTATAIELVIARQLAIGSDPRDERTSVAGSASLPGLSVGRLLAYSAPVALSAICMRLFDRVDIFALRLLNGSLESVAAYGVAQNLALAPGVFGGAFTPALIAALSYRMARGDDSGARELSRDALRAAFLVLPLSLLAAGAAPALIPMMFGESYRPAVALFALLVIGAVGTLVIALTAGVLIAAGQLRWTIALTAPLFIVAVIGHLELVPRFGAVGAATVTCGTALLGAISACVAVHRLADTPIPLLTLLRGIVLGGAAGWVTSQWRTPGIAFFIVLSASSLALVVAMFLSGEVRSGERAQLSRWARERWRAAATAGLP